MSGEIKLRALSLGAGVQSTTLALMAAAGEIGPMPDCAIFADTQWEPRKVYDHLDRLEKLLPFPVYRVSIGNILDHIKLQTQGGRKNGAKARFASIPWFTLNMRGEKGQGRRQCSREFKIEPITRKQRELLGVPKGARVKDHVEVWIGISTDEAHRMKPAFMKWQTNRWPLIEAGMSRKDCLAWMKAHGHPEPPKSACIGCPFHSDAMWKDMKDNHPEEWKNAVEVDRLIRGGGTQSGMDAQQFMHAQRKPLEEVDLRTDTEKGQRNLFGNECEGICGV